MESGVKNKKTIIYLLPVRRVLKPPEVRLQLPSEHFQRRRLADSVGPNQPQNLPWPWNGQTVQLERVWAVAVGAFPLEVFRQIDDHDRIKGAFFNADAAADAELLGDPGELGGGRDLDAEFSWFLFFVDEKEEVEVRFNKARNDESLSFSLSLFLSFSLISYYSPTLTTGQLFLHSWRHFLGLHLWLLLLFDREEGRERESERKEEVQRSAAHREESRFFVIESRRRFGTTMTTTARNSHSFSRSQRTCQRTRWPRASAPPRCRAWIARPWEAL